MDEGSGSDGSGGDDEEQEVPACWDIHKFSEVFQRAEHLKNLVFKYNPSME